MHCFPLRTIMLFSQPCLYLRVFQLHNHNQENINLALKLVTTDKNSTTEKKNDYRKKKEKRDGRLNLHRDLCLGLVLRVCQDNDLDVT